jgi:hypothetical protein
MDEEGTTVRFVVGKFLAKENYWHVLEEDGYVYCDDFRTRYCRNCGFVSLVAAAVVALAQADEKG